MHVDVIVPLAVNPVSHHDIRAGESSFPNSSTALTDHPYYGLFVIDLVVMYSVTLLIDTNPSKNYSHKHTGTYPTQWAAASHTQASARRTLFHCAQEYVVPHTQGKGVTHARDFVKAGLAVVLPTISRTSLWPFVRHNVFLARACKKNTRVEIHLSFKLFEVSHQLQLPPGAAEILPPLATDCRQVWAALLSRCRPHVTLPPLCRPSLPNHTARGTPGLKARAPTSQKSDITYISEHAVREGVSLMVFCQDRLVLKDKSKTRTYSGEGQASGVPVPTER
ncbi:hypothetical protein GGX14DRAFT_400711 [Mycena pura]|uniref:Uncharacterized protein n=1 Tax=Mycena pura TaxID=153505 RepID=A0AAD6V2D5_9AGAR|nr:hypothetical protein GGX14DRAFT_400711 [Mycena pura]